MQRLQFYSNDELARIVARSAHILNTPCDHDGAHEIAKRSRGTPRITNRLLKRVRDYSEVKSNGNITKDIAHQALNMLKVDSAGLDLMDRNLLLNLIERFQGGPAGIESLAASISEERGTVEEVIEPYLIQRGFIHRTPRGRVATPLAFQHFGVSPKQSELLKPEAL